MNVYRWLLSNWLFVLEMVLVLISICLAIWTYQTLKRGANGLESGPPLEILESKGPHWQLGQFRITIPSILIFFIFIILLIAMVWSISNRAIKLPFTPPPPGTNNENSEQVTITVQKGDQAEPMTGLFIKLDRTDFDESLNKYKVAAVVSSSDKRPLELIEKEPSSETVYFYPLSKDFKIRILSAYETSAVFSVERVKK